MTSVRITGGAISRWSLLLVLLSIGCWTAHGPAQAQSFEQYYDSTENIPSAPGNPWQKYYSSNLVSQAPGAHSARIVPVAMGNHGQGGYPSDCASCQGGYADAGYGVAAVPGSGLAAGGFRNNLLITTQRYDDHWVSVAAAYVYFDRDNDRRSTLLTSDGVAGSILLDTGDANLQTDASGAEVSLFFDLWHGFDLELGWMGGFEWKDADSAHSTTNSLYSVFSDFGISPAQGFEETDQATYHGVRYVSELDNYEINAWFRWSHTTKPWTGAWIFGVRYLQLREALVHETRAVEHIDPVADELRGPGEMRYRTIADNDLVGFNFGLEAARAVAPGLMISGNFQAGIYGNSAKNETRITATTITDAIWASEKQGKTAFVGELNVDAVYRLFGEFYIRGGYKAMYIEGVSFAPDNFTTDSPFVDPRPVFVDATGDLFLSGFHLGAECQW